MTAHPEATPRTIRGQMMHDRPVHHLQTMMRAHFGVPFDLALVRSFIVENEHDLTVLAHAIWLHDRHLNGEEQ